MAKIKLKKSLQVILENSKQALIKAIAKSMMLQPPPESELSWLLLELSLQHPFPPTIALAKKSETDSYVNGKEHPLGIYNAPDLELFSENQNIILDFDSYDELFETANQLLEEIEYEDMQSVVFQLYVEVCKALMLESANWTHLKLASDFHVTARDFEDCDEIDYLKKLLPKKVFNKLQDRIDAYDAIANDEYKNDETIIKVNAVVELESNRYDALLATLTLDICTDVFVSEEIYFLKPFHVETTMHKRVHQLNRELSTQRPNNTTSYYQYKFRNNIPQLLDCYQDNELVWRKIFQHEEGNTSYHKFFLNSRFPEFEDYAVLKQQTNKAILYERYADGYYDEITYHKNDDGQIINAIYVRSIFDVGYKMDSTFEYIYEYKNDDLFKISCVNPTKQKSVSYCKDDSFMTEAIDAFIDHLCSVTIDKMKNLSLENLDAVVLVYDNTLPFYFNVNLLRNKELFDISTYEQHEKKSAMMNLSVYVAESVRSPDDEYFSRERAKEFVNETYTQLCATLSKEIQENFQLSIPVVTKFIHDELDL